MALLWIEGFEADTNVFDYTQKYEAHSGSLGFAAGRWGGNGLNFATSPGVEFRTPNLGNRSNAIMGGNFRVNAGGSNSSEQKLFALLDGTNEQLCLYWFTTAQKIQFRVKRGSTVVATTSASWSTGWWILVEWKVVLDTNGSNGSVEVRVNGISELLVENTDTTNHGSLVWNRAYFASSSQSGGDPTGRLDDVYVLDDAGAKNNTWMGEHPIEGMAPTANGNRNQWTPSSASANHFSFINENQIDFDTTYLFVHNTDDGLVELFTWGDSTFLVDPVHGLFLEYDLRMDTGGQDNVRPKFRNGSSIEANGTTVTINQVSAYKRFIEIFENDPTIAGAWTVANWNAMQVGLESLA